MLRQRKHIKYLVLFVLAISAPIILESDYLREVFLMTYIFAILALSLDIIMGWMGLFSFGHAAFFGLGIYGGALITQSPHGLGLPVWLGFLGGIAIAAALAVPIGYISLLKLRGMYLGIVTFGFGGALYLTACNWYGLTLGMTGIYHVPYPVITLPYLPSIALQSNFSYYYFTLALLILTTYFISRLLRTRFGRALISLRENEELARSMGVNALKYYVIGFTLAGALAGLAGVTYVFHVKCASPIQLGLHYMFIMLIMVIVGGTGTMGGPIVGAFIYTWGSELLRFSGELRFLILGAILLVFIIFVPRGIYPALVSLGEYLSRLLSRKPGRGSFT